MASAYVPPQPGDWLGILLGPYVEQGTRIENANIRHAGKPSQGVEAAVTLEQTGSRVLISGTTFYDNAQADVFVDCESQPLLTGNTYSTMQSLVYESNCP